MTKDAHEYTDLELYGGYVIPPNHPHGGTPIRQLPLSEFYSVAQLAKKWKRCREQVTRYCRGQSSAKLEAIKFGSEWMITRRSADNFVFPPPGNPALKTHPPIRRRRK